MAIVKQDHILEEARFVFDETGDVVDLVLYVNFQVYDDVAEEELTRVRKTRSVWSSLTSGQKTQADTVGKRLQTLADAF